MVFTTFIALTSASGEEKRPEAMMGTPMPAHEEWHKLWGQLPDAKESDRLSKEWTLRKNATALRPTPDINNFYKIEGLLGRGRCGKVRRATTKTERTFVTGLTLKPGVSVAIKIMDKFLPRHVLREVELLWNAQGHGGVLAIYEVFEDEEWVYIVTELCDGGNLSERIQESDALKKEQIKLSVLEGELTSLKTTHAAILVRAEKNKSKKWLSMEVTRQSKNKIGKLESEIEHISTRLTKLPKPERYYEFIRDLFDVVAHVHSKSILHRDIKLANIALKGKLGFDDAWTLKLIDFGIAYPRNLPIEEGEKRLGGRFWLARNECRKENMPDDVWRKLSDELWRKLSDALSLDLSCYDEAAPLIAEVDEFFDVSEAVKVSLILLNHFQEDIKLIFFRKASKSVKDMLSYIDTLQCHKHRKAYRTLLDGIFPGDKTMCTGLCLNTLFIPDPDILLLPIIKGAPSAAQVRDELAKILEG